MAKIIQTVSLRDARFYAPIGYYEEERILGNTFFVSIDVSFPFDRSDTENLMNTLNYEELYQIAVAVMKPERKLLESAAAEMLDRVITRIDTAIAVDVTIRKPNPPFGGDLSVAQVKLSYAK